MCDARCRMLTSEPGLQVSCVENRVLDQRARYLNPTVVCAVLRRTATAMVAARFIQPLFDQSERALSVAHIRTRSASVLCGKSRSTSHIAHMHVGIVLAVPCNALAASATDPRAIVSLVIS